MEYTSIKPLRIYFSMRMTRKPAQIYFARKPGQIYFLVSFLKLRFAIASDAHGIVLLTVLHFFLPY